MCLPPGPLALHVSPSRRPLVASRQGAPFFGAGMDLQSLVIRVERIHDRQDATDRIVALLQRDYADLDRRVERIEMRLFWLSLAGSLAGSLISAGVPALARILS